MIRVIRVIRVDQDARVQEGDAAERVDHARIGAVKIMHTHAHTHMPTHDGRLAYEEQTSRHIDY